MPCNRCGADIHSALQVCPHCGARQKRQPTQITCAHCGRRVPSELTLCPQCGRELQAQRFPTGLAIGAAAVLLLAIALYAGLFSDVGRALRSAGHENIAQAKVRLDELGGKMLDTASSLAATSVAVESPTPTAIVILNDLPTVQALALEAGAAEESAVLVAPTTVPEAIALATLQAISPTGVSEVVSATVTTDATAAASPASATPTPTAVPPQPTATPAKATATPTPLPPTPTQVPPTPTSEAVAAAGIGGSLTYTVQPGDDWYRIAQRFGITQEALAAYNGQTPSAILHVNDRLRIPPAGEAVPTLVPTAPPTRTRPPTATPTATPQPTALVLLPAPTGMKPDNSDGFSAGSIAELSWSPVPGFTDQDVYLVTVHFDMPDGQEGFWSTETTATSTQLPRWVFDAAAPPDRLSRWTVQVRRRLPNGQVIEMSPPSPTGTFYWR